VVWRLTRRIRRFLVSDGCAVALAPLALTGAGRLRLPGSVYRMSRCHVAGRHLGASCRTKRHIKGGSSGLRAPLAGGFFSLLRFDEISKNQNAFVANAD
jgi:hypothetical protein